MKTTKRAVSAANADMARIKKDFKYSRVGITPEMADAVNAHVKVYGRGEIYNHFGDADGNDPDWWDWRNGRVHKLKLKPAYWVVDR